MEWAAKDFGAALVDHTDQNRVGDDDDARDAQRSRQTRQVTPSAHRAMLEMRTVAGPSSVVQLSGDRQPHAARRSPLQGATADHLTRSEHSSFRAAHLFPAPVRPKRVLRYFTDHCRVATGGDAHRRRRSKHPRTPGLISVVQWRIGAARRCLLNVRAAPAAFAWPGKDEAARVRRPTNRRSATTLSRRMLGANTAGCGDLRRRCRWRGDDPPRLPAQAVVSPLRVWGWTAAGG